MRLFCKEKIKNNITSFLAVILAVILCGSLIYVRENRISGSKKVIITTNKAEEYFYAGEYNKAIEEYKDIMLNDENAPIWLLKIAEVYSVKGDYASSRKYIEDAKKSQSTDAQFLNLMVFTEFMNKDYKIAAEDGEKALNHLPQNKSLIKTMFTVYMANNKLEEAKILVKLYPVNQSSAYDYADYARMLMIVGNKDDGYKMLQEAFNIDKDEYKIYDVLSQISVYNKDELLEDIMNLSKKEPTNLAYKMWLGKIYSLSEGTAPMAKGIIDSLKGEDVGKIEIKLIEAAVLQNTNENEKADEMINKIITDNKDDYRVLHTAAWYYLNKKDINKAEMYCKESIIKNKNYPDNYGFLMPEILKAQGKSLEGEPYVRTALYLEPYNYNIMLTISNYYWYTAKNSEKALEYFKFAEIVKPNDAEIKYNMALIYLTNKKDDDAINILKQCVKLSDAVPKYHRTLGTIYFIRKDYNSAIKEIRYAYNGDENDILTLNNAGCYYISVDGNLERGMFNLDAAKKGITKNTDEYTKKTIESNYDKGKKLYDAYMKGKGNEKLSVPEFTLFY